MGDYISHAAGGNSHSGEIKCLQMKAKAKPIVISYLRFSTPEQARGDSIRRQLAASEEWASARSLSIDHKLRDPGLSGFTGANVSPTADLGRLLEVVKENRIPSGSILLVENLDRLSRQDILPALRIFTTLIESGLKVVTLADNKEYDAKSVTANPMDLMYSIMILSRGHEESRIKSHRVSAAWRAKQSKAGDQIVTKICPQWLKRENGKWVFIPEAVKAIRAIAKMVLNGHTWKEITRDLNANYPKTFGKKHSWSKANATGMMRPRTLIGEYQPCRRDKRNTAPIPIGEPIAGYYPAVLDSKTYRDVQRVIASRRNGGGGRTGQTLNIWSNRIYDVQENKIYISEHGSGLRYKSAGRLNGTSDMPMTPLFEVDRGLVFGLLQHLSMNEIELSTDTEPLHKELVQVESRIEKLSLTLGDMASDPAVVVKAIDKLQSRKAELLEEIAKHEDPPEASSVTAALKIATEGDLKDNEIRRKLKVAIGSVVEKVYLYFIREYRDHIVSAVFHLIDGTEVDWAFRVCFKGRSQYSLEFNVNAEALVLPEE